jgi:hypothetical protein
MLKRISTEKIPGETRVGNRVRAVSAFILLLCTLTLALFLRFDGRSGPLAYEILCLQFPFLGEYRGPDPSPQADKNDQITIEHAAIDPVVSDIIKIRLSRGIRMNPVDLSGNEPRILIYHTHTTVAYRQTQECMYVANGEARTLENNKNIVAVGERLTQLLRDKYGISVIHDTTNHEPPKLGTSFAFGQNDGGV